MLNWIIQWSLGHRLVVLVAWAGIVMAGVVALSRLPLDAFPDTTPVQVQINTVAPALSPLEIERQITFPIEQAISGLPHLEEVRSVSKFGFSQVTVIFADGTDIYFARQVAMERLQSVELAPGIERPQLGPVATGLGEIFHYLVTGKDRSLAELRTIQDWIVKPQLRAIPGVAEVNSWGGDERQVQVVLDPLELQKHDLSFSEVIAALEENNMNVGGGTLDHAGESSLIQGLGMVTRPEDVGQIVVAARDGVPIHIDDLGRIVEGREIRRGAVTADGHGEVVLGLGFMLMGENSHEVASRLKVRLEEIKKSLPSGVEVNTVYDRTALVDKVLHTVRNNLFEGALLVIAVLFVFLGNLRAGLLVAAAIPLSMLCAFDLMLRCGIAGSLMSLGALDFGLIVDSSVIQVENAMRRLAEDKARRPRLQVVRDAVIEVRKPTMFGEMIIMIVYLPILALEGVEGKLFRPMALTVIFALLGSMLLSLTLMPVLTSMFLPRHVRETENRLVRSLRNAYQPILRFAMRRRALVLGLVAAILAATAWIATRLGSEFVPRLREGALVINTIRLAGVSVDESVRYGMRIERALMQKFPDEIERVWTRTGTAEVATDPMGLELSDVFITLHPTKQWRRARTQEALVREMEFELAQWPGMRMVFTQPIEMRVNEMIAGIRSDVGIKLFGDDFETLKAKAREIEAVLKEIRGSADVVTEQLTGQPTLEIQVDRAAIARYGISAREVLAVVEALGTREVGQIQDGERRFPITVRLDDRYRQDPQAVGQVLVAAAGGQRLPLAALTRIRTVDGPSAIQREWAKRRVVVQANVRGRDVGSYVAEAAAAIDARVELPTGYYVRFGGQFEHLERGKRRLMLVVPLALALIFVLLYFTYGRLLDAVRLFTAVPLAAVGGIVALWVRDIPFSISAGVGFIALSGVAVLNGLVLLTLYQRLESEGMTPEQAVEQGSLARLRAVLMTALVASLGFVPMAFNTGIGAEVQRPLATVVIGGIVSSTLLTLLVLPGLYLIGRARGSGRIQEAEPDSRRAVATAVVIGVCLMLPAAAHAQPRTLREVLAYARTHAPLVDARRAERDRVGSEAGARGFWLPEPPEVAGEWAERGPQDAVTARDRVLEASLRLEPFGQGIFRARAAGAGRRAGLAEVDAQARGWAAGVAWLHHERLRRVWLRTRSERQGEVTDRLVEVVEQRFEAGDASGLERDLTRVEAAAGRLRILESERTLREASEQLAAAIGWPIGTALPEPDSLELVPAFPDTTDLLARALLQRPDLLIAQAALAHGRAEAKLANARLFPEAELGVFGGTDDGEDLRGLRVGLTAPFLGWPLAERGARAAEQRRLEAELRAATRDAHAEIAVAQTAAALAFRQVALFQEEILPGIQTTRQRYAEAYAIGQVDLTSLLLTEQRYRDAEHAFAAALGTYLDALRDLEVATGLPVLSGYELVEEESSGSSE